MAIHTLVFMAACALCLAGPAEAAGHPPPVSSPTVQAKAQVIDLTPAQGIQAPAHARLPPVAVLARDQIVTPLTHLPELPEPDMFAMMLVGLLLIGYRVSRGRGDKFT